MGLEGKIKKALEKVYDPELGVDIVRLGLVYGISEKDGKARVKMTLTSPACPLGAFILASAKKAVESIEGIKEADIELVWEPAWTPEKMDKETRKKLGV